MTNTADFGEYTGVHGVVTKGGVAIADVMFDMSWSRDEITVPRSGAYSDKNYPGKVKVKCKIKRSMVDASLAGASLNDTPITGTSETLLTASHVLDASDWYEDMEDDTIASPSRIRYTLQTKAITTGGTITIIGEDADGNAMEEIITVSTASIGETWTTTKVFKKVYGHTIRGIDSADDLGTFKVESITGNSHYTVGEPLIFDLVGKVEKSDGSKIQITMPDCWIKNGGLKFEDAGKVVEEDLDVVMRDPDLLQVDEV